MKYYSFIGGLALVATAILPTAVSAQGLHFSAELQNHRPIISVGKHLGEFKDKKEKDEQSEQGEHETKTAAVKAKEINGTVTAVSTSTLTVKANDGGVYTVDTTNAEFDRRFGADMVSADIQVNDHISVKGMIDGSNVAAKEIHDLSLQARNATFDGKVTSLGAGSFMLQSTNRGVQTVNMTSTTVIKKNGQPAVLADLVAGAQVRVSGIWDRANNVVTAKIVNIIARLHAIRFTGTVTAKTNTSLTVTGTNNAVYAVDTTNARVVRHYFGRTDLSEVSVGDKVNVWGKHEDASTNIMAMLVQDLSISKKMTTTTTLTVQ